jgi:hypothetical protein
MSALRKVRCAADHAMDLMDERPRLRAGVYFTFASLHLGPRQSATMAGSPNDRACVWLAVPPPASATLLVCVIRRCPLFTQQACRSGPVPQSFHRAPLLANVLSQGIEGYGLIFIALQVFIQFRQDFFRRTH